MSTYNSPGDLRRLVLGSNYVTKSTGTLAASTISLFTVTGGNVLITSLFGYVTTAVTVANSYKLQINPTAGDTADICQATDIGTTDTAAGTLLGFLYDQDGTTNTPLIVKGSGLAIAGLPVPIGDIESVSAGTDGVITWYASWVPADDGALLVAA